MKSDVTVRHARLADGVVDIRCENGRIAEIGESLSVCGEIVEAAGRRVIPGLVDTHIHGFGGFDTADGRLPDISRALTRAGTTTWFPTAMTDSAENLRRITRQSTEIDGTTIPGFHLEGPYISKAKKGAQNEAFIKAPSIEEFRTFHNVKLITVAPECSGMEAFIRAAGCRVSIGHTACSYTQALAALAAGADGLTHTFNAMPPFLHRDPGPIGAAWEQGAYAEVICDGLHVSLTAVKALYRLFGSERLILVSDCIRPAGLPDGTYESGGLPVVMKNGELRLTDGTLAGGSHSLLSCVQTAVEQAGIPFDEAVKMASETPARRFSLNKGRVTVGYDADLVVLNDDWSVACTVVGGTCVYGE